VRDAPPGHPYHARQHETLGAALRNVAYVLREPRILGILVIGFVVYSSTIALRGLWAGPYLADVYGLGALERGNVLVAMSVALIVFIAVIGPLDRRVDSRKRVVIGAALAFAAASGILALVPELDIAAVVALLCLTTISAAANLHILAHGRALFPDH